MDLVLLTETIIKKIVADPESVSVKEFTSNDENTIQIEVLISKDDIGRVIGKDGKMISSIRTIIQASASINLGKRVELNVDSY